MQKLYANIHEIFKNISSNAKNLIFYLIGGILLIVNKVRHDIIGYTAPRDFSINETTRTINYDIEVVKRWVNYLAEYQKDMSYMNNKVVLELGPGPDLGAGLLLIGLGVKRYIALDVNRLIKPIPVSFYNELIGKVKNANENYKIELMNEQVKNLFEHCNSDIIYIVDKNFNVNVINDKIDIVLSNAAFEHFNDVEKTICQLGNVMNKKGVLISLIDLKTHTRWIREKDPLNIYRYNDFFWNLFRFEGSPNRIRINEYCVILEKYGWVNIKIEALQCVGDAYFEIVKPYLSGKFKKINSEMKTTDIILMAEYQGKNQEMAA